MNIINFYFFFNRHISNNFDKEFIVLNKLNQTYSILCIMSGKIICYIILNQDYESLLISILKKILD